MSEAGMSKYAVVFFPFLLSVLLRSSTHNHWKHNPDIVWQASIELKKNEAPGFKELSSLPQNIT